MAKTPAPSTQESRNEVAVASGDQLPAHLQQAGELAGLGNSQDAADSSLPFLALAQSGSPQLKRQDSNYIEGLQVGGLFNTATKEFWSGEIGVPVIPCGFQKNWVEWVPRDAGGGYVDSFDWDPMLPRKMGCRKDEKLGLLTPAGNQLQETAYTFCLMADTGAPIVIGASSTQLGAMRDWMALRRTFRIAGNPAPAFSRVYQARTAWKKNEKGDWYVWKMSDGGWLLDPALFESAKAFALQISKGAVKIGRPQMDLGGDSADGGGEYSNDEVKL